MWNKKDENKIGKNPKMSWIWWLKKIFSYLALKWCPYTQIQFICLALLMNWRIGFSFGTFDSFLAGVGRTLVYGARYSTQTSSAK